MNSMAGLVNGFVGKKSKSEFQEDGVVEKSPSGQYVRYNEILGIGAFKTVYNGFDEVNGIEVAWSQVSIEDDWKSPKDIERLHSEVHLMNSLKHENIIKCYSFWVDENKTINIITELFTSGSLRQYLMKHKHVDLKAIKNWATQILRGLRYLHSHNPPIIHRDLKCDNIFVNGNRGVVKIGDLGLASISQQPRSVVGTPEFMAPELYDEEYNELVDIYSFGMCMLELVTCEYPYSECNNQAQIYKKVISGIKPASLGRVKDTCVKQFIEKCLVSASLRLSAAELLKDPFLSSENPKVLKCDQPHLSDFVPKSVNMPNSDPLSMDIDTNSSNLSVSTGTETINEGRHISALEFQRSSERSEFRLRGKKTDDNSVLFSLCIADLCGQMRNIEFMFYLDVDTALSIAGEMVEELNLSNEEVAAVAELVDSLIIKLVIGWKNSFGNSSGLQSSYEDSLVLQHDQSRPVWVPGKVVIEHDVLSQLANDNSALRFADDSTDQQNKGPNGNGSERSVDSVGGSVIMSELTKNSEMSSVGSCSTVSDDMSLLSISSLFVADNDQCKELKLVLDAIDMEYHQHLTELMRIREEAVHEAKQS